jgi:CRISPR/Cas system-associated exonuclease Cas4 (RecB family)
MNLGGKARKPKDDTLARMNAWLEQRANTPFKFPGKEDYVSKPTHKPSSMGLSCLRRIYYEYFRTERDEKINFFLARIFDTGNYYEAMVMSWLKGIGEHIPYRNKGNGEIPKNIFTGEPNPQFPITDPELRMNKGYIDNVAVIKGRIWLYEIKSKKSNKFDALTSPDPDHLSQVSCYFKCFNEQLANGDYDHIPELKGFTDVAGVKVIYINKNTSNTKLYVLEAEDLVDEIIEIDYKIRKVNDFIDLKKLPPMNKKDCKYCPFKSKCKNEWNSI